MVAKPSHSEIEFAPATRWTRGGWRIVAAATAILALMPLAILSSRGWGHDGALLAVRESASAGFLMFLLPFTASAAAALYPCSLTAWIRARRRYFGIAFALAMIIHAGCVTWFVRVSPSTPPPLPVIVLGGIGYVFILAMLITSFDRPTDWIGPRAWHRLHATGVWYVWTIFVVVFLTGLALVPAVYGPMLVIAIGAGALRIAHRKRRKAMRRAAMNAPG